MRPARILELRAGRLGAQSLAWRELYMTAEVERSKGKRPNKGRIEVYNLSDESLRFLEQATYVQVLAGEGTPSVLFEGDLSPRSVVTRIEGVDRITALEAGDGRAVYRDGKLARSYPEGASREEVLTDVLASTGLAIGHIGVLPPRTYDGGLVVEGRLREVLDELLDADGEWTVQDGVLEVHAAGAAHPDAAIVIAADTGMVGSPERTDKGISVETTLLPQLRPQRIVAVESIMVSGFYRVTKVSHSCDSRGLTWSTRIEGVPL